MSAPVKTNIASKIIFQRGEKVILAGDLAELYGTTVKRLNQQVKRNPKKFPEKFMFQLTEEETMELVTNCDRFGKLKHSLILPYVFTEYGALMAATVLNSDKAIETSVLIIEAFVRMRRIISENKELADKLDKLEKRMDKTDGNVEVIFTAIHQLMAPPETPKRKIGFTAGNRKKGIKAF